LAKSDCAHGDSGSVDRCTPDVSPCDTTTYETDENVLASCLAFLDRESPDLAAVVRAWRELPEPVRAGIVAMVKAARA